MKPRPAKSSDDDLECHEEKKTPLNPLDDDLTKLFGHPTNVQENTKLHQTRPGFKVENPAALKVLNLQASSRRG